MLAFFFFAVVFEVPAGLLIKNGELSHSLWQFSPRAVIFFLALSLKGSCNAFFDWLIIPLPIPIPFTLVSLDRKRPKRKRDRKKKKLFWSFWLRFRRASDRFRFRFTLDRNAPCASILTPLPIPSPVWTSPKGTPLSSEDCFGNAFSTYR